MMHFRLTYTEIHLFVRDMPQRKRLFGAATSEFKRDGVDFGSSRAHFCGVPTRKHARKADFCPEPAHFCLEKDHFSLSASTFGYREAEIRGADEENWVRGRVIARMERAFDLDTIDFGSVWSDFRRAQCHNYDRVSSFPFFISEQRSAHRQ